MSGARARARSLVLGLASHTLSLSVHSHTRTHALAALVFLPPSPLLLSLSEALARVHLAERVTVGYVRQAHRLLRKSVAHVQHADVQLDEDAALDDLANQALEG